MRKPCWDFLPSPWRAQSNSIDYFSQDPQSLCLAFLFLEKFSANIHSLETAELNI